MQRKIDSPIKDMTSSGKLTEVVTGNKWPVAFSKCISESKKFVAFRYVIVDNSRSMLKRDGRRLIEDVNKNPR